MNFFTLRLKRATAILSNIKNYFLLVSCFSFLAITVSAQNYTVTSNGDTHAVSPTTSALDAGGQITLRSACEASTQIAGTHIITIPASITNINLSLGQITIGSAAVGNNITINGGGKAVLTINQTTVNRIFFTGAGAITFNLNDVTLNYTGPVGSISGGGGAIIAGGINANTTLTNVAIKNFNIQSGNGGAMLCSTANTNNFTAINCDFDNNTAGGGGGAVSIVTNSTANFINCKFTNNKTGAVGASVGGSGGALLTSGTGNGGTYTLTNCTFTNNQTTNPTPQTGGAAFNTNGTLNLNFCRFVGNTITGGGAGQTLGQSGGSSVNAIVANNNWWGVNSGPSATDLVVLAAGGTITSTKWLQLKTSVATNPICPAGSSTITASFLSNSASEALTTGNIAHLVGLPISFVNPVLGSLSGAQATIQNSGTATVTFTAGATGGTGSVNAVVDNIPNNDVAPAIVSVTINSGVTQTVFPSNTTVCAGANATFTASFSGTPTPTIQWQVSTNGGGTYNNIAGATSSPLTFATVAGNNGNLYRAVGTNTCNSTTSSGALLTVNTAPTVAGNPSNTSVPSGSNASFTASFSGTPTPTLQWQVSTNGGGTYNNIAGATSSPLVFVTNLSQSGNLYRCVGTNSCGSINTTGALLTVTNACATSSVISVSGASTICTGTSANIKVTITGGASPFTVVYNNGVSNVSVPGYISGSNISVSPASSTNYTLVSVTDANLCVGAGNSGTANINVTPNNTINLTSAPGTNVQTVIQNTAITNITYSTTGATGASVTGLPAGVSGGWAANVVTISGSPTATGTFNYTVTLTGGCGIIQVTGSITVNSACAVTGTATPTNPACFGGLGSASVTLSGTGSGAPGTYTLDGGSPVPYNTNPFTIPNLTGGNHTIVATVTASGCVSSLIGVNITAPAQITGSGTTTPTTCGNGSNGTATITLSSSTAGTYSVDGGSPGTYNTNPFTITGLSAGNHTIVAISSLGCMSANITVSVGGSSTFTATAAHTNLSQCGGVPDGTITITPQGGTAPYTYSWTGLTGSGNPATTVFTAGNVSSLTGLNYGYYNVTVTDAGGCGVVTINNIHVEIGYLVSITYSGSNSSTCGNTGSIILYGNAGLVPYTYSLSPGNGPAGTYQPGNTFTGLAAGSYTAYVKDAGGCVSSRTVTVAAAAQIVINPFVRPASNCGADGSIQVFRTGGTPPYTYSLDGTNYVSNNLFSNLAAGPYTVYVKDGAGCVASTPATVTQGAALTATVNKVNTSTCVNDGSIQVNATGGFAPYTYSLNGGSYQPGNSFGGLGVGNYSISVKDSKGCLGSTVATIELNQIIVTSTVVNASACNVSDGKIQLFRTGGYGPYLYSIDGNTYQSSNTFLNLLAGTYVGYVKDSKSCIAVQNGIVVGPSCNARTFAKTIIDDKAMTTRGKLSIEAYPNPTATEFTLSLKGYTSNEKVTVTVTDLLGRKMYSVTGLGSQQFKFGSQLKPGIYMVQVSTETVSNNIKIVKE